VAQSLRILLHRASVSGKEVAMKNFFPKHLVARIESPGHHELFASSIGTILTQASAVPAQGRHFHGRDGKLARRGGWADRSVPTHPPAITHLGDRAELHTEVTSDTFDKTLTYLDDPAVGLDQRYYTHRQ
jgi:hypothetical protein